MWSDPQTLGNSVTAHGTCYFAFVVYAPSCDIHINYKYFFKTSFARVRLLLPKKLFSIASSWLVFLSLR